MSYLELGTRAHVLLGDEVVHGMKSSKNLGISTEEHERRMKEFGLNKIPEQKSVTPMEILWGQVNSMLIYILIVGSIISFVFEHYIDAFVILAVVVINVSLGFLMECQAVNATKTLQNMMSAQGQIMRDGIKKYTDSLYLTLGDIFFLRPGDIVPADGRVLHSAELTIQEAPLTGEAHAINKVVEPVESVSVPLAERHCMVYSGTQVLNGTATCVTTATGPDCEIGKISGMLAALNPEKTALLIALEKFGHTLSLIIIIAAATTFGIAYARDHTVDEGLNIAIGVAVAAIPEGLPSCITVTFAVGVSYMASRGAVIKSLPAVETLGSVSVICSDKTGTLTTNKMEVQAVSLPNGTYSVDAAGTVTAAEECPNVPQSELLKSILPAVLCNNSTIVIESDDKENEVIDSDGTKEAIELSDIESQMNLASERHNVRKSYKIDGGPTEASIVQCALRLLDDSTDALVGMQNYFPREGEIPFDSKKKYMATLHVVKRKDAIRFLPDHIISEGDIESDVKLVMVKGAPEVVLSFCNFNIGGGPSSSSHSAWTDRMKTLARNGMRVVAVAVKEVKSDFVFTEGKSLAETFHASKEALSFTLSCMVGIIDPPRPEAIVAIREAQTAGITVKMITGDHPVTALAISERLGLKTSSGVVTGAELDVALSNEAMFDQIILQTDVFARTTPEHKLRIVESLRRQNIVCSMTGDGVNDAPALKAANIGVAMGISGTEVAKDAANMIITDDNFATIVDAIRIGRNTYNNLLKIITFILSANGGQAFSIIAALIVDMNVPITALQILWVNMLISVSLGIELAFDEPDDEILRTPPRPITKKIFGKLLTWRICSTTVYFVLVVLGIFQWEKQRHDNLHYLRTCAVNALVIAQAVYIFNCRNTRHNMSPYEMFCTNKLIYLGLAIVAGFQGLFTYCAPFQYVFESKALDATSWWKIIVLAICVFVAVEIDKYITRKLAIGKYVPHFAKCWE